MISKLIYGFLLLLVSCSATFAQQPTEKNVTVYGAKIHYLEAGDKAKPTIILLHGINGSSEIWRPIVSDLASDFHVVAPDMIGFGKSDKPLLKYRAGTFADFLDQFMTETKIEKASIIGNSLGGWVAALVAINYPSRVEKLLLLDSSGLRPAANEPSKIYSLNGSTRQEIRANMKLLFASPVLQNDEKLVEQYLMQRVLTGDGYTVASLSESFLRAEDFLDSDLSKIKQRTLIVWGKQDGIIPVNESERFRSSIAGATTVLLDVCGHMPQIERADDVIKIIRAFIGITV